MSGEINYKMKYNELKSKFMSSVDMAFRLGFEEGSKQEQNNQMMQQQAQQQELANAQSNGIGAPGEAQQEPGQDPDQEMQNPDSQNPAGSELDQHIEKLESMLGKSELDGVELKKALDGIKSLQANMKQEAELKKSARAIPEIAKALHKPKFNIGRLASHNMNSNAKTAVNMQEKIVSDIMKSWEEEDQKVTKDIKSILNLENLIK